MFLVVTDLLQQALRLVVELEAREDLLMTHTAARVLVHDSHELLDRVLAVSDDVAGFAFRCCDELAVDDEQAMVVALDVALDDDRAAVFPRLLERDFDFVGGLQVDRHAAAVIPGERFQDHREPDRLRGTHGILLSAHQALLRHRQAEVAQDAVGFLLVAGQFDRDVPGLAGGGRLDALLVAPVAELHEAVAIEPEPGNVPLLGRTYQ